MISVTHEIYDLVPFGKWLGNESVSKEKWIPGGDELILNMKGMESSLRLCRLRTVPLLGVLTKIEQY